MTLQPHEWFINLASVAKISLVWFGLEFLWFERAVSHEATKDETKMIEDDCFLSLKGLKLSERKNIIPSTQIFTCTVHPLPIINSARSQRLPKLFANVLES